jgi:hypothetical protein
MQFLALTFVLVCAVSAAAATLPDYALPENWVCRPGNEARCTSGLDAVAIAEDGTRVLQRFAPAADPPVDCFFIYPTISEEAGQYSDLRSTREIVDVTRSEAGRLASRCRLFVPVYRQLTSAGLAAVMAAHGTPDWRGPYADVLTAWRWYVAHDNGGRGVVLIGHSQGAILLHELLADEIDGQPDSRLLAGAFLAGDLSLAVPKNAVAGGALKHIPICTDAAQVGCVYVWASYPAEDNTADRMFGRNPPAPLVAACANPAAPQSGSGKLKAYLSKPASAPGGDPPWLEVTGALSAQCVSDAQGNVLRVTIHPGPSAQLARQALREGVSGDPATWGLHGLDLYLTLGNVLDRIGQETATWLRARGPGAQ